MLTAAIANVGLWCSSVVRYTRALRVARLLVTGCGGIDKQWRALLCGCGLLGWCGLCVVFVSQIDV